MFTLRAITWTGQALLMFESQSKKVLGLLWAELRPSTFSSMAKRTLQTKTSWNWY